MDILTCITVTASCVTALATAFTVIIAVHQFKVTLEENERTRQREREQYLEDNASLIDVWVACTKDENSKEHHVVIDNSSEASIRNLQINCIWNNTTLDDDNSPIEVRLLPKGFWIVSRNYKEGHPWDFPESISIDALKERYAPRFSKDEDHIIKSYFFDDVHGKSWGVDCKDYNGKLFREISCAKKLN